MSGMTEDQIAHMVNKFLTWSLPENFNPDNGISFERLGNKGTPHEYRRYPAGTNLLDYTQAEAMLRNLVEGLPGQEQFAWLIEAPGRCYLATRRIGHHPDFFWTTDHTKALRFFSEEQADGAAMSIRALAPALWAFAANVGESKIVQHSWIGGRK